MRNRTALIAILLFLLTSCDSDGQSVLENPSSDVLRCSANGYGNPDMSNSDPRLETWLSEIPTLSFEKSNLSGEFEVGSHIGINSLGSFVPCDFIETYKWEQIEPSDRKIELANSDQSGIEIEVREFMHNVKYIFRLSVTSYDGRQATDVVTARWQVKNARTTRKSGIFSSERTGHFQAESINSVFVSMPSENKVSHIDIENSRVLNEYPLPNPPMFLRHSPIDNTLYVAMTDTTSIAKINLLDQSIAFIPVEGTVRGMNIKNSTLYFLTDNGDINSTLYTYANNTRLARHGQAKGSQILFSNGDELIIAGPESIGRYALKMNGDFFKIQEISGRFDRITLNERSGIVYTIRGNRIYSILSFDLEAVLGFTEIKAEPSTFKASYDYNHFILSTPTDVRVFDAAGPDELERYVIHEDACNTLNKEIVDAQFDTNKANIIIQTHCGPDAERSVFHYFDLPLSMTSKDR